MTLRILCLLVPLSILLNVCHAQQGSAEFALPNLVFDDSERTLRVNVEDVSWTYPDMKDFVAVLKEVPGVRYFNPVLIEGQTQGYFELNYVSASAADLQTLLRSVFCTLKIKRIKINQAVFNDCRHIEIQ